MGHESTCLDDLASAPDRRQNKCRITSNAAKTETCTTRKISNVSYHSVPKPKWHAPPHKIVSPDLTSLIASSAESHTFDFLGTGIFETLRKNTGVARSHRRAGPGRGRAAHFVTVASIGEARKGSSGVERGGRRGG